MPQFTPFQISILNQLYARAGNNTLPGAWLVDASVTWPKLDTSTVIPGLDTTYRRLDDPIVYGDLDTVSVIAGLDATYRRLDDPITYADLDSVSIIAGLDATYRRLDVPIEFTDLDETAILAGLDPTYVRKDDVFSGHVVGEYDDTRVSVPTGEYINLDGTENNTVAVGGAADGIRIGNPTGGNYTTFEADGTMKSVGAAKTWDDSQAAQVIFRTGGTALALAIFTGGIYQYVLDLNDEIQSNIQLSHRYVVNSAVHIHIHLANKTAIVGAANVGIELEWSWGSINDVFSSAATVATVNCSFTNAAALTHRVVDLAVLSPAANQGSISSYFLFRIKRVAGTSNTYNTAGNIFLLGVDAHIETDTLGSRQEYIK